MGVDPIMVEDLKGKETWRVFRIMSEFIEGFDELSDVGPAVSIFGSARIESNKKYYKQCVEVATLLSKNGYAVITGGGPGLMEAANKGALQNGGVGVNGDVNSQLVELVGPVGQGAGGGLVVHGVTFSWCTTITRSLCSKLAQ